MTPRAVTAIFGAVGIAVPLTLMAIDAASAHGWWPKWVLYAWPTSYMLGATSGQKDLGAYLIIAAAVALNGVLYGYLGNLAARFFRRVSKSKAEQA